MMRADVEGSFASFLVDAVPFLGGAFAGVTDGDELPLGLLPAASSGCPLFFLRAMVAVLVDW
jgi:hypothetical protein